VGRGFSIDPLGQETVNLPPLELRLRRVGDVRLQSPTPPYSFRLNL